MDRFLGAVHFASRAQTTHSRATPPPLPRRSARKLLASGSDPHPHRSESAAAWRVMSTMLGCRFAGVLEGSVFGLRGAAWRRVFSPPRGLCRAAFSTSTPEGSDQSASSVESSGPVPQNASETSRIGTLWDREPGGGSPTSAAVVDAILQRAQFETEALSLAGGTTGEARRRQEQARIENQIRRIMHEELPPHCRLEARDVVWVSDDLCFVGVGLLTNFAGFRYAMSRRLYRARRVAAVRDIFDRNTKDRATLQDVFKIVTDDVAAMLTSIQEPPQARLVNDYMLPANLTPLPSRQHSASSSLDAAGQENAAPTVAEQTPNDADLMTDAARFLSDQSGPLNTPHMGEFILGRHDVDFVEYLHELGIRIVPVENKTELDQMEPATIPIQQSTNHLLMVAPTAFEPNLYAAHDNYFMHDPSAVVAGLKHQPDDAEQTTSTTGAQDKLVSIRRQVLNEFAQLYYQIVQKIGARVHLFTHDKYHDAPDSVFPNNWFSTHTDLEVGECTLVLYPMKSPNRRRERRPEFLSRLHSFRRYTHVYDLTREEVSKTPRYLEGTGSLVLDRPHRTAYMAISERSDQKLARTWARVMGYEVIPFHATDGHGRPIYHTNVMMCIGTHVAVFCAESVEDSRERALILDRLRSTGHEVVTITREQMCHFCGNVLEIESRYGRPVMAMSTGAYHAFTPEQRQVLREHLDDLVHADIRTIEVVGGGGVRCSIAELM